MAEPTLADLMTPIIEGVPPICPIGEALRIMAETRISSLLVMDDYLPVGIVTERDAVRYARNRVAADVPVERVMSAPVLTAPGDLDLRSAFRLANSRGVRHLVVVDAGGRAEGIVSETDFIAHLGLGFYKQLSDVCALMEQDFPCLPPWAGMDEVLAAMERHNVACALACDDGKPVGIITERDVVRVFTRYPDGCYPTVGEVMTAPVATVPHGATAIEAAARMSGAGVRHLVVVGGAGEIIGVLTQSSLLRPLALEALDDVLAERHALLREQEQVDERMRLAISAIEDRLWDWDLAKDSVYWNPRSYRMLGYRADEFVIDFARWQSLIHPDDLSTVLAGVAQSRSNGKGYLSTEYRIRCKDGAWLWLQARGQVVERGPDGTPLRMIGTHTDISRRKDVEERLRASEASWRGLFESVHEAICIIGPDGRFLDANQGALEMYGRDKGWLVGRGLAELADPEWDARAFLAECFGRALTGEPQQFELRGLRGDGEALLADVRLYRGTYFNSEVVIALAMDITERKRAAERMEFLAHHDALTRLPNRVLLADRLQQALANAHRSGRLLAVCYLDLDGFKPVNDTFGHAAGDRLLVEIARRLTGCIRAGDTLARLGGDEFAALLGGLSSVEECEQILDRILAAVAEPYSIDGRVVRVSASVGVTLFPRDGAEAEVLLRHADQAMYRAKQAGRSRYQLFDAA